jgi:hypothetical protein
MPELPEPFFAKCISRSDQVVLKLGGECDAATLEQLNDALREAVAERQRHARSLARGPSRIRNHRPR